VAAEARSSRTRAGIQTRSFMNSREPRNPHLPEEVRT